jgi:hypothetical protein
MLPFGPRVVQFVALAVALVASRALDILTTLHATPDLARETNPLHRVLGLGWRSLIVVNVIIVIVLIAAAWRAAFGPAAPLPNESGLDYESFIGRYWFGRPIRSSASRAALWLPAASGVRWSFIGGPIARLVVVASIVIAAWNRWAATRGAMRIDRRVLPVATVIFWSAIAVAIWWLVRRFLASEYARYRRQTSG